MRNKKTNTEDATVGVSKIRDNHDRHYNRVRMTGVTIKAE